MAIQAGSRRAVGLRRVPDSHRNSLLPQRAISFGLVGASGVVVQLLSTALLMGLFNRFSAGASCGRDSPPQARTTGEQRPHLPRPTPERTAIDRGLLKFLLVASLPALANVGLATSFYTLIQAHTLWAQLAGIVVVYVWNYGLIRFVWNNP